MWNVGTLINVGMTYIGNTLLCECFEFTEQHWNDGWPKIVLNHYLFICDIKQVLSLYKKNSSRLQLARYSQCFLMLSDLSVCLRMQIRDCYKILSISIFRDIIHSLAFCTNPTDVDSWWRSLSTQHDQIIPPEQESIGLPPANTHEMLSPHSNLRPLYLHVCGITAELEENRKYNILFLKVGHYCVNTSRETIRKETSNEFVTNI